MQNKIIKYILIFSCLFFLIGCSKPQESIFTENPTLIEVSDITEEEEEIVLTEISKHEKYDDFYGWIYITGTKVSTPIAQTDDNEYYLRRGLNKIYHMDGTTFVDYSNTRTPEEESNLVVYGHNLENEKQFSTLFNLKDEEILRRSKIYLYKNGKRYLYKPFAAYITDVKFNYIKTRFRGNEFSELLGEIIDKSNNKTDVSINSEDKIITLSTCTNEDIYERFVVSGVLKEID